MIIRWPLLGVWLSCLATVYCRHKDLGLETHSKCPMLTECPFRAEPCQEDDDCSPDAVCCKSPCGKVCTKQLFTGCQTLRMAASRRAKSLGVEPKSVRMPRCNKQGGFEEIQCDNEIVSSCWCVDETGFEIAGTRAPAASLVNCTAPKPCADATCRMFCPHGFALTKDGCPTCRCRDPCDDIKCPNALECHLEELACADPPCPPVPTCKRGRSLDNICPVGDPLRISDTVRPFLCGTDPGKPTCPPMYQCLVQKGNDYGVCCPASLKIQKTGQCPIKVENKELECGNSCGHDLECPSVQKCCQTDQCGSSCMHPKNFTECYHQKALSEVLAVSERAGRGYVPQCTKDGQFEPKQCSRNGLVCWCVDRMGRKLKGSMGPADIVDNCTLTEGRSLEMARSLDKNGNECERLECAAVCEYGFKLGEDGCHTCKCDDPCDGYTCPEDEECVNVKEATCTDFLCPTLPVCRPKAVYANPCEQGTPLTDDLSGAPVACALRSEDGTLCPSSYECTAVPGSTQAVCCPVENLDEMDQLDGEASEDYNQAEQRPQTMCEYLREFSESMEGTREGMALALPTPECDLAGNYLSTQCDPKSEECWCVDNYGTEIPRSRTGDNSTDCDELRKSLDCLDLTCRMGCEYGFVLSKETSCPTCQCRDPCSGVTCNEDEQCQLVEVSCKDHYCPPVPACLPKKVGQCPYLVPAASPTCDFECNSDLACNGTMRCCSNGCGTQCIEPLLYTACQHQRTLAQHQAHESGMPAGKVYIPTCTEDGSYSKKQCHPGTKECWCVDDHGFEISQTRSRFNNLTCDPAPESDKCPQVDCADECEHGFIMDREGCRTCECVDPCTRISCRGEGETCRLVAVECVSWPCPSVPMCLPKKENPCQNGEPLKMGEESFSCGPEAETCPSSHKCQLSPVGEYAVCCPKPRDVCFEQLDTGRCQDPSDTRNLTRYFFNSKSNRCEMFIYAGCQGNHNNFHTESMCNTVCPVLSQCERLREKNQRQSERYKKATFAPRCDPQTGNWQPVQCLEHVGVCWCVSPQGEPVKGTLTRGAEPECNFRQARNRASDRMDVEVDASDLVLEELMMQLGTLDEEYSEPEAEDRFDTDEDIIELPSMTRCEALGGQCDEEGKFLARQCEEDTCWCVDEAGNQLVATSTFVKGQQICSVVPIESAEVTLGFRGEYDDVTAAPVVNQITKIVNSLNGNVNDLGIHTEITGDALYIKFSLIGSNKVDVAYKLEQMVMQQRLPNLIADITRSRVIHRPFKQEESLQTIGLQQREIVSQAPVSVVAPYHTALIVIAAASAFVISVLTVLVILYRRKMHSINQQKIIEDNRFVTNSRPIYIELPNEKYHTTTESTAKKQ
ncbi:kielin/chordin-like protein [Anthonomus grandis grandis]|uniref:kielin/chordin-like protein n=1 Tax=Anthonomus grandis grandis TaxID=2921223 RepID=UPI0021656AA2|nr:kielin/chordin-like protein [Anthonomus grandis grandis]